MIGRKTWVFLRIIRRVLKKMVAGEKSVRASARANKVNTVLRFKPKLQYLHPRCKITLARHEFTEKKIHTAIPAYRANTMMEPRIGIKLSATYLSTIRTSALRLNLETYDL